jgi:enterobactin synthetase component F
VTGSIANHDLPCTHPELVRDRWLDDVAAVLAARLKELDP